MNSGWICCTKEEKIVVSMKAEKTIVCMPACVESAEKNEKPMNRDAMAHKPNLART
jgi:hypothetical protein